MRRQMKRKHLQIKKDRKEEFSEETNAGEDTIIQWIVDRRERRSL